jgi:hypothetical protein
MCYNGISIDGIVQYLYDNRGSLASMCNGHSPQKIKLKWTLTKKFKIKVDHHHKNKFKTKVDICPTY